MWATVIAAAAGLVGVTVGALLTHRREHDAWLREQRRAVYVELLGLLTATTRQFATDLSVSRLQPDSAAESGHDFAGAEWRLLDNLNELEQLRPTLLILAGRSVLDVYEAQVDPWIASVSVTAHDEHPTASQWGAVTEQGWAVVDRLALAARLELHRPVPTSFLRRAARPR